MQRLEVRDEIGAVEDAVAEVARQRGHPRPAQQAAEIAHRVFSVHAGPIGERGSGEHDRSDKIRVGRAHHHDLPAGLAVADQTRFALGFRVARSHLFDKPSLCLANILDRLTGHGFRQKADEIAGMAGPEGNADLAVVLHAADPGTVAGTRVKNDERSLALVDSGALGRNDAHEAVIHRSRQRAPIEHELSLEAQYMRRSAGIVLGGSVASLPQYIQQQNRALPRVDPVVEQVVRPRQRPRR